MERITDRPAVHKVGADQSGEGNLAFNICLSGLCQTQQQKGDEGDSDLDTYGILGAGYDPGDLGDLLAPGEEQFDGPTPAVEIGDFLCKGVEIVRQDAQHLSG